METKFNNFLNENIEPNFNLKTFIQKGVAYFINAHLGIKKDIKSKIKYNDIVEYNDILQKMYDYMQFENKYTKKGTVTLYWGSGYGTVVQQKYFNSYSKYELFGLFGLISIIGVDKIRQKIEFFDDVISELRSIPVLTGNIEEDSNLQINLVKTLKAYKSPTRNMCLLMGTRFMNEINELEEIYKNSKYY
jgi:hypothetical protein